MSDIRSEISKNNKYWIHRERYLELFHWCKQYPIWQEAYIALDSLPKRTNDLEVFIKTRNRKILDPVGEIATQKAFYFNRMLIIEETAKEADPELWSYILEAVTQGRSYEYLQTIKEIPCSRDTYYDRYRKFFWLLNQYRDRYPQV